MKKFLKSCASLLIAFCLGITFYGCGSEKKVAESNESTETNENIYNKYYEIVQNKLEEVGAGKITEFHSEVFGDNIYLQGLAYVKLIDFDKDGKDELLLAYANNPEEAVFEIYADNNGNVEKFGSYPATDGIYFEICKNSKNDKFFMHAVTYGQDAVEIRYIFEENKMSMEEVVYKNYQAATINDDMYLNGEKIGLEDLDQYLNDKGIYCDIEETTRIGFMYHPTLEDVASELLSKTEDEIKSIKKKCD